MIESSEFEVISVSRLQTVDVNWQLCFLCQSPGGDKIIKPTERKGFDIKANAYHTISNNLKDFQDIGELPKLLLARCKKYDSFEKLCEVFLEKKAVFHKTCVTLYSKPRLKRKLNQRKSLESIEEGSTNNEHEEDRNKGENDEEDKVPEPKRSRRSGGKSDRPKRCFFCDSSEKDLHLCMTFELNDKVESMAKEMRDPDVLGKMASQGDMIADDTYYHIKCLVEYKNKYRSFKSSGKATKENSLIEGIALSEVANSLRELMISSQTNPVFLMKDLRIMYQERLKELGASEEDIELVNVTRLKQCLLKELPGLREDKEGRSIMLTLDGSTGRAVFEASRKSSIDEGVILAKAASIIRNQLFEENTTFNGDLSTKDESLPLHLLHLLGLIIEGGKNFNKISISTNQMVVKLAQLIKFNAVKYPRRKDNKSKEANDDEANDIETKSNDVESKKRRHSKENEPQLPLLIGLSIHSRTRKRGIVEFLASQGLCISYHRVLEIEDNITKQLCEKYNIQGIVSPPTLKIGLFVITAIDNIDHDPSSSTAKSSFHGTSISAFQYPSKDDVLPKFEPDENFSKRKDKPELPKSYTDIKPVQEVKPEPSDRKEFTQDSFFATAQGVESWTEKLKQLDLDVEEEELPKSKDRFSFSSYHAEMSTNEMPKTTSTLLPLLEESINSPAMVRHCMDLVGNLTNHLNPGQVTVVTGDQPVYALGKQIQWQFSQTYANTFWMLGPLHIEMALLDAIGDWLEGSGWTAALKKTAMDTSGRIDNYLKGSKVKKPSYGHQVSLATLIQLADKAFEDQEEFTNIKEWKEERSKNNASFCFWMRAIELETLLFKFKKSLRNADFALFVKCIEEIMPWMFALDHTHYARWMSVFLKDLQQLPTKHPSLFEEFKKGHFTVKKSNRKFSNMGVDQAHEQNNKIVKIDGGAIGILDNPNALLRWAVAGPIVSQMVEEANGTEHNGDDSTHHEDTQSFEETFRKDVKSFYDVFAELGNPFKEEEKQLVQIVSRVVLDKTASDSVFTAHKTGEDQFKKFTKDRLCGNQSSIYNIISKNNIPLFRNKNNVVMSGTQKKIATLKADCKLYANLFIACQSRKGDLESFFAHENHCYPISISEYGQLRKCNNKSDLLKKCFDDYGTHSVVAPTNVDMKVIDGAAFVNSHQPQGAATFSDYCKQLKSSLVDKAKCVKRVDVVFDVYKDDSLKSRTREVRAAKTDGIRVAVRGNTPIVKDFGSFMRNNDNKTDLFVMLANAFSEITSPIIVSTKLEDIVTNQNEFDHQPLAPCNHEEADTRLFLHVLNGTKQGYKKVTIVTVDTDVVVIALYQFWSLDIEELWVEFGVGLKKKYYAIHQLAKLLTEEICRALPFWFAFTGCDTVSAFAGKGKKTAWSAWECFPQVTEAFVCLPGETQISDKFFRDIQRYVVILYDRTSPCSEVNQCRRIMFTQKQRPFEALPPTRDALGPHTRRGMRQSRTWCLSLERIIPEFVVEDWGYKKVNGVPQPIWMTQPETSQACKELVKCGCKKSCSTRCKCKKAGLSCTELCHCSGGC